MSFLVIPMAKRLTKSIIYLLRRLSLAEMSTSMSPTFPSTTSLLPLLLHLYLLLFFILSLASFDSSSQTSSPTSSISSLCSSRPSSSATCSQPHSTSSQTALTSLDHFLPLRRTARPTKKPPPLQDYVCSTAIPTFNDPFAVSTLTPFVALFNFTYCLQLPLLIPNPYSLTEPYSYKQESLHTLWVHAMEFEI